MNMSNIFDYLDTWRAPKRLTIGEQDEVYDHVRKAKEHIENVLYVIEEQNPPAPKRCAEHDTSGTPCSMSGLQELMP